MWNREGEENIPAVASGLSGGDLSGDDLAREIILEHYKAPRNYGTIENADITYEDNNPFCGDELRIDIRLSGDVVEEIKFSGKGCSISIAAASMLTEEVEGKRLEELRDFGKDEMLELLDIPLGPVRVKCGLLALKVLKAGAYGMGGWPGEED